MHGHQLSGTFAIASHLASQEFQDAVESLTEYPRVWMPRVDGVVACQTVGEENTGIISGHIAIHSVYSQLPFRLPPALLAIGTGAILVAVLRWLHLYTVPMPAVPAVKLYLPHAVNIFALFRQPVFWPYLTIIVPLAALDTLASLMILESVKIAGDDYATRPSLLMNGVGTIAAACLGSPFPTTLYLGHAAHKANGARSGYSVLNGLVTLVLCTTGILPVVLRFVPLEVAAPVIIWFGLITVAQAVTEVPANQAIAVVMGLIPALAQWVTGIADTVARKAGSSLMEVAPRMGGDLAVGGLIALGQGSLLTSMLWAAALAYIVQRRFAPAAAWLAAAAGLSAVGIIHAYKLSPNGVESLIGWWVAPQFTLAYAGGAAFLLSCAWYRVGFIFRTTVGKGNNHGTSQPAEKSCRRRRGRCGHSPGWWTHSLCRSGFRSSQDHGPWWPVGAGEGCRSPRYASAEDH